MPLVVNAETSAKVDKLEFFETSTSQPLSNVEQHLETLSASQQSCNVDSFYQQYCYHQTGDVLSTRGLRLDPQGRCRPPKIECTNYSENYIENCSRPTT